jgi:PAS fold
VPDSTPDALFRLDARGRLAALQGGAPPWGTASGAWLGRKLRSVLPIQVATPLEDGALRARREGVETVVEYGVGASGGRRVFEARLVPLPDAEVLGLVQEVTARARNAARERAEAIAWSAAHGALSGLSADGDSATALRTVLDGVLALTGARRGIAACFSGPGAALRPLAAVPEDAGASFGGPFEELARRASASARSESSPADGLLALPLLFQGESVGAIGLCGVDRWPEPHAEPLETLTLLCATLVRLGRDPLAA